MNDVTARRRSITGFGIATLIIVATLLSLGFWQLQRRSEKHALIAALDARIAEAPVALPLSDRWPAMSAAADEFRRVTFTATYKSLPDAMVYPLLENGQLKALDTPLHLAPQDYGILTRKGEQLVGAALEFAQILTDNARLARDQVAENAAVAGETR